MLTRLYLTLFLFFLVFVLEVKAICSEEISSKDREEAHSRRETTANFPTFQNLQGFAQLNTSQARRNDEVHNSDRSDHPLRDSISTDSSYFYICPYYYASQTFSASSDSTPKCMFYMNGGTRVTVTSCGESGSGGYCSGDQYLRLTDAYAQRHCSIFGKAVIRAILVAAWWPLFQATFFQTPFRAARPLLLQPQFQ
eukprot:gene7827-8640_t